MAAIDAKEIAALAWSDFEAIFTLTGCTARYDERLYYLPLALRYLPEHPDEGLEFVGGFVYFVAENQGALARDGFLAPALAGLRACFDVWTAEFEVIYSDAAACRAKGWRISHRDYVRRSWPVTELVTVLVSYGLPRIAEEWIGSWIAPGRSARQAAWLLELAKEARSRADDVLRRPPAVRDRTATRPFPSIDSVITNELLLQAAYDEIKDTVVAAEASPTYWPDLVEELGLTP